MTDNHTQQKATPQEHGEGLTMIHKDTSIPPGSKFCPVCWPEHAPKAPSGNLSFPQRDNTEVGYTDLSLITFLYRNHRGEVEQRKCMPIRLWFGSTAWHHEAQWLLEGFDLDKQGKRDYDMAGMLSPWKRLADSREQQP